MSESRSCIIQGSRLCTNAQAAKAIDTWEKVLSQKYRQERVGSLHVTIGEASTHFKDSGAAIAMNKTNGDRGAHIS